MRLALQNPLDLERRFELLARFFDIGTRRHRHRHIDATLLKRRNVLNRRSVNLRIRHDYPTIVGRHEVGLEKVNRPHRPRIPIDRHKIANLKRAEQDDHQTGRKTRQRPLERQTNRQARRTENRRHRRRLDAKNAQTRQHDDDQRHPIHAATQKLTHRLVDLRPPTRLARQLAQPLRHPQANHKKCNNANEFEQKSRHCRHR